MIDVQVRIREIVSRMNEIKDQFAPARPAASSFRSTMEEIQEKVFREKAAARIDEKKYDELIREKALKYSLPEKLVKSVIRQESGFNEKAVSSKGAKGLMQLMPETAELLGIKDVFNPAENIEGGTRYLKMMLEKFNGDVVKALAAYNAGPETVEKKGGVPRYEETVNYVKNILNDLKIYGNNQNED